MLDRLRLDRPLIFFDTETTGISPVKDRIIELCGIKVMPDRSRAVFVRRFNPEMPIPPEASAIHGITDMMVKNEPPFRDAVREVRAFFAGCDLAGYNVARFDVPILAEEFLRAGLTEDPLQGARIVDAMTIYFKKEPRTLSAALKFYAGEELVNAHSAEADVEATIKVLEGQLRRYDDLPQELAPLSALATPENDFLDYDRKFGRDRNGDIIFTFGKNKGMKVSENPGMVKWMLDKDFAEQTKLIARKILNGEIQ